MFATSRSVKVVDRPRPSPSDPSTHKQSNLGTTVSTGTGKSIGRYLPLHTEVAMAGPTIDHFSSATLTSIFKHVHAQSSRGLNSSSNHHVTGHAGTVWDEHEPPSFPYTLASVSSKWRNLMATIPSFWTRCLVFLDLQARNPEQVEAQFRNSQNLRIQVRLLWRDTRSNEDDDSQTGDEEGERQYIRVILDLLAPHARRCAALGIDAKYRTSLPDITDFATSSYQNLSILKLHHHDRRVGHQNAQPRISESPRHVFFDSYLSETRIPTAHTPIVQLTKLTTLHLDGYNFALLCHFSLSLIPALRHVQRLYIWHYHPPSSQEAGISSTDNLSDHALYISFHKFMTTISKLNPYFLSLKDVDFPLTPVDPLHPITQADIDPVLATKLSIETDPQPVFYPLDIHELHLTSIASPLISYLFPSSSPNSTYSTSLFPTGILISKSTLYNTRIPGSGTSYLTLSHITSANSEALQQNDLSVALSEWSGAQLTLIDCPTFNDDVLQMFTERHRLSHTHQPHHWVGGEPIVANLRIVDCPGFSAEALKELVESSAHEDEPTTVDGAILDQGSHRPRPKTPGRMGVEEIYLEADTGVIQEISVQGTPGGKGVPNLDGDLRRWFQARIGEFVWRDLASPGQQEVDEETEE